MMITQKELLVLLLINAKPRYFGSIFRLIMLFNRADFPGHIQRSINILVGKELLHATGFYKGPYQQPIGWHITDTGKLFLKEHFDEEELLAYINSLYNPSVFLEIVQKLKPQD